MGIKWFPLLVEDTFFLFTQRNELVIEAFPPKECHGSSCGFTTSVWTSVLSRPCQSLWPVHCVSGVVFFTFPESWKLQKERLPRCINPQSKYQFSHRMPFSIWICYFCNLLFLLCSQNTFFYYCKLCHHFAYSKSKTWKRFFNKQNQDENVVVGENVQQHDDMKANPEANGLACMQSTTTWG